MEYELAPSTASGWGSIAPLIGVAVLITLGIGAILLYKAIQRRRRAAQYQNVLDLSVLQVVMPRPNLESEKEKRDPKDLTALVEPVFTMLHNALETKPWKAWWFGQPTFSFEIVAHDAEIYFYVVMPKLYRQSMERIIHAQYPSAHIAELYDHDLFLHHADYSAVAGLNLAKQDMFPIRTYKQLEADTLGALTNTLSKVGLNEGVAIQVLVQPTEQTLAAKVEKALQNIQQGKDFSKKKSLLDHVAKGATEVGKVVAGKQQDQQETNEASNIASGNVRLTALQEQQTKLLVEKVSKLTFRTQIRIVARAADSIIANQHMQTALSAFAQFQSPEANSFKVVAKDKRRLIVDYIMRSFSWDQPTMILNAEELASVFHFPNRPLETPNIHWLSARRLAPPTNLPRAGGLLIGTSKYRGSELEVRLQPKDRMRHVYAIGQTGVGKTNLFQGMILDDIRNGHGVCYIDPNGDAIEWILRHIPKERAEDVILVNPADTARPIGLNLLEYDPRYPEHKTMVINELIAIFDKLYDLKATGGPMFEQYMRNAALLIMDDPASGSTLMEIPRVLSDAEFRKLKLSKCTNQTVIDFWVKEAEKAGGEAALANIVPYVTSKLTQFTASDIMRPIVGQQQSAFNFRQVMDEGKILLVSLPKGLLGDMSARLLGMIISGKIQISAFSRQDTAEELRKPFYLYVDEFQNFTSKTFATILSEARKYALSLNITHQYIDQLDEETRSAVFGNVGTIISWRLGPKDAEVIQKVMEPLTVDDLINIERFTYYVRMLIDGAPSLPFTVSSLPPDTRESVELGEAIRQLSRLKYGRERGIVEAELRARSQSATLPS
jgi:hypothetical protein